jgi:hypothetical protein
MSLFELVDRVIDLRKVCEKTDLTMTGLKECNVALKLAQHGLMDEVDKLEGYATDLIRYKSACKELLAKIRELEHVDGTPMELISDTAVDEYLRAADARKKFIDNYKPSDPRFGTGLETL